MNRVAVDPTLLRWARERADESVESLVKHFPRYEAWEEGELGPTLKQLEDFARLTRVPVGYLFLSEPPVEEVPIPDLRTVGNEHLGHPSPELLDTIYLCQHRQAWYRDWARSIGDDPCAFVGASSLDSSVEATAAEIREQLGFDLEARRDCRTWTEGLRQFIGQAEDAGILVMVSGIVGSNTHRALDPEEFRGFALADELAPLVFINGKDTKAAQMFTLAHELAHIWLGESALTDIGPASRPRRRIEVWCNEVAAELLVPLAVLRAEMPVGEPLNGVQGLARRFKVSTLVIMRRLLDAGALTRSAFEAAFGEELARLKNMAKQSSGGDFYLTQAARLSRRFARALVASTLEGDTLYTDAFRMLGVRTPSTFRELGAQLGLPT